MKFRIRLLISYDGTHYEGWQKQPEGVVTVQDTLEKALEKLLGVKVDVVGASRTDSGVHAWGQVVHFDSPKDPTTFKDFSYSLQAHLPRDIVVKGAWLAPSNFDATRDADQKTYRYLIHNAQRPTAIRRQQCLWVRRPLDLNYLNECSKIVEGFHDFRSFQNTGGSVRTTEREILKAHWYKRGHSTVVFEVTGRGFLKQMVRNLVGTMIDLYFDELSPDAFKLILEAKDRRKARSTAPPEGLYLCKIKYPQSLDNKCRKL